MIFGERKVLLLDTGAGRTDVADVVTRVINNWLRMRRLKSIELVVAHSHAHGDHISGDDQLRPLASTVIAPDLASVKAFFGIAWWPEEIVQYDLGRRVLDIIPIPGHEVSSIAIYDRKTAILFTGDTLYAGRLYIGDQLAYVRSIKRLIVFTRDKKIAHILGCHIENTRTPFVDYPIGTVYQPDEHSLELGYGSLLELYEALDGMGRPLVRKAMRDFTIWP